MAEFDYTGPIKVRYIVPKALPLTYADQMSVAATSNEMVLSLFQTDHPVAKTAQAPSRGQPMVVDANCVVRIVLTHAKAKELHRVLGDVMEEHEQNESRDKKGKK